MSLSMFLAPLCTHSGSKYSLAYGSADCQHTDRGMQVGTQAAPRPWKEWPRAAQCTASALGVLALLAGLCLLSRLRLMMGSASSAPSGAMVVLARRRGQPAASLTATQPERRSLAPAPYESGRGARAAVRVWIGREAAVPLYPVAL